MCVLCPRFVSVSYCRGCCENEKRERSLERVFIVEKSVEPQHTLTQTLGSHTLPQTLAVTQMWREEAITRGGINRSGWHAHTHTHTPVQREDAVAPRIGSVQCLPAGGKREERGRDEYRLVVVWRNSKKEECVLVRWLEKAGKLDAGSNDA